MKYRAIVRQNAEEGDFVIIQRKDGVFQPWQYFAKCEDLERADVLIKGLSTGTITTGIWEYDKAGNRIHYGWM